MSSAKRLSSLFAWASVSASTAMRVVSRAGMTGSLFLPRREGSTGSGADQALGGGARLLGDFGAGEHAGDLLAPALGGDLAYPGGYALAAVERVLGYEIVTIGAGRDLRRVGDRHDLDARGRPREAHANGVGDRPADPRVDLVEDERRGGAAVVEPDLQRQEKARQFASRGDAHQRAGSGAGIGLHPKLDAVDAARARGSEFTRDLGREARALELERLEFGAHRLVELRAGTTARSGEPGGARAIMRLGVAG